MLNTIARTPSQTRGSVADVGADHVREVASVFHVKLSEDVVVNLSTELVAGAGQHQVIDIYTE